MRRRQLLAMGVAGSVFAIAPASACREPKPKDQTGYSGVIMGLVASWLSRDYPAFRKFFLHPELQEPFANRTIFDEYFSNDKSRQLGSIMFNGPSAVFQVITVQGGDVELGICGGHAWSDLFLVKFFPGFETPVIAELRFLDGDTLAKGEWGPQPSNPAKG